MMKTSGLMPTHYLLIAILLMIALHFIFPLAKIIPLPWIVLGLLPLASGIVINLIADKAFHNANTTVKPFQESTTLITDGVFHYSRNPMYLGFVFILIGIATLFGSLSPWLIVPLFVILMNRMFIQTEERMLEARFGQSWLEYKARVRRWL
jgi:protein-S-isoprenylcysteine O-methyltransferase Ste14